jgi:hypothetical protein
MMSSDPFKTLQQVNENLRSALIFLRPERRLCSSIKPQDFSGILQQILRAAECLRHPHHAKAAAAFEKEVLEYRGNLDALKRFLPDLQVRILAEKSRLETARSHLAAAASWAQLSKKTL